MTPMPGKGLYAITPQWYPDRTRLVDAVGSALAGGAVVVQFRDKSGDARWRRETAGALCGVCAEFEAPLIINDDVGLAAECGADGVHIGRDDADPGAARAALGAGGIIGVSCYGQYSASLAAAAAGADYVAFGSMHPSPTKPGAVACDPGVFARAGQLGLPLVAIGGITPENGAPLLRAGAHLLAVISAIFEQDDVRSAATRLAALWGAD